MSKTFLQKQREQAEKGSYAVKRAVEFGIKTPVGDQLDAIWKALESLRNNQPMPSEYHAMQAKLQQIKTDIPKNK